MGGGDLNSKKSWHPNTMKNQERVWKAEQAAAEEKKRMIELQRERAQERDRAELNNIIKHSNSSSANDNRLAWMYDKPDKKVDEEAYLLGKSIDKNAEQSNKLEQDVIPAVSRRVVGSSMMTVAGDTQVDMSRKIREDPLLLIKERERAARAALLNNPLQRRRLAELLRKEQDLKKESKTKKTSKKKDKDLDDLLAAKLNALGGKKGIDLATLLDSDDSSPDSSPDDKKQMKKKKKKREKSKKKKKESKHSSDSDDDQSIRKHKKVSSPEHTRSSKRSSETDKYHKSVSRKRRSSENGKNSDSDTEIKKYKKDSPERHDKARKYDEDYKSTRYFDRKDDSSRRKPERPHRDHEKQTKNIDQRESGKRDQREGGKRDQREGGKRDQREGGKRGGMSEDERAARLAEMAAAGAEREIQRGRRVAEQRAADVAADRTAPALRTTHYDARALPESLESRIHSNRHYIQRDKRHMNEHFARR